MKLDLMAVLLTFPALATSACEKRRDEPSTTRTTGATNTMGGMQASSVVSATTRIAGARCDRQAACREIGPEKRYETREICTRDETNRAQGDIRSSECSNGVDDTKLQSCLDMIGKQDCAKVTTSLTSINECTTPMLCAPRP